ncbi:MAG: hemolysin family protein, partial [Anaerolineales bacterium]
MKVEFALVVGLLFLFDQAVTLGRTGLLNARPFRLAAWRERSTVHVERVLALLEHPRLRPSLRLARILTRLLIAGSLAFAMASYFVVWPFLSILAAGLALFVMEMLTEKMAMRDPEGWAVRMAWLGRGAILLFAPLMWVLMRLGLQVAEAHAPVTEDEIKTWADAETSESGLEREERQMIYSILQFGDTLVREIMVPRLDMTALSAHTALRDAVKTLLESGHSRVPVYRDTIDDVIGVLYAKDLLKVMGLPAEQSTTLTDLLRPAYFVPETKKANALLTEMQSQRIHMALVVDEYGSVAGLVTLEDVLEEITGEIRDEYDAGEDIPYQQIGPDEYVFKGGIDLDEFNEVMGSNFPKTESDTVAGFIYDQLGRIPAGGEVLRVGGFVLTVE